MKKRWLIEIRNVLPVLYFRGVNVNGDIHLFTINANHATQYKTEKEAMTVVDKVENINGALVVVEHGF